MFRYVSSSLTRPLHVLPAMPPAASPATCPVAASPAQFTATATGRVSTPRLTPSMVWRNEWLYHTRIRQHGRTNPIITEYLHTVYLFTMSTYLCVHILIKITLFHLINLHDIST